MISWRSVSLGHVISKEGIKINPQKGESDPGLAKANQCYGDQELLGLSWILSSGCEGLFKDSICLDQSAEEDH